jgi:stearoyl-CoA desaturase (delta-9 desaturase)
MLSEQITSWAHYARDLMRERRIFWLNQTYPIWTIAGLVAPAVINGLVDGSWLGALNGFLWGGMVRMFAMNQASWCVGSLCHLYGSRPFRTHDNSANNWPVALFTFGEGLQNNHHAFPSSAHHAVKWYEPDVSAWTIRALQKTGLIWNVLLPSPAVIEGARRTTTAPSNNN